MDAAEPCLLLWPQAPGWRFDFYRCEHGHLTADHAWSDGDDAPADQISGTAREAELHGPAGAWIWQLADLIAKEAQIGPCTEC